MYIPDDAVGAHYIMRAKSPYDAETIDAKLGVTAATFVSWMLVATAG